MMVVRFETDYPDGRTESLVAEAGRVLVGSAAHCEIRLPAGLFAGEQLSVRVEPDAAEVEVLGDSPEIWCNGRPIRHLRITELTTLELGDLKLRVIPQRLFDTGRSSPTRSQNAVRLAALLAVLLLPALGYVGWQSSRATTDTSARAPSLWAGRRGVCSVQEAGQAELLAMDRERAAAGKRERHPFHASEGVEAVLLYEAAAACFSLAGLAERAAYMTENADALRADIDHDYRTRQLRLAYSLATRDYGTSRHELRILRTLTAGMSGRYVEWLATLARKLEAEKER